MPTPKENFLALMRNDRPTWLGDPWSCFVPGQDGFAPVVFDAITPMEGGPRPGESEFKTWWGVTMRIPEGSQSFTPWITEENKVIKDITRWRDYVRFPDVSGADWGPAEEYVAGFDRDKYLLMCPSFGGVFEFSHYMMGFEDALVNYLVEPEAMFELLSAYTDWKIENVRQTIDHLHPDIIHSHDDWGNKKSLFMSPDTWRELIKPHYQRFYGYIKSRGVLVQHHADCVCHEVAEDMVELGIDMWQGVIPQNDIRGVLERTEGKLCLLGGIDMALIDFPDAPEEVIRGEVRRAIDEYMPLGHFMPCVPNIMPIYKRTELILNDELNTYGAKYAAEHF